MILKEGRHFRASFVKKMLEYQLQSDIWLNLMFSCRRRIECRLLAQFGFLKQYFTSIAYGIDSCQPGVCSGTEKGTSGNWGSCRFGSLNLVFYLGGPNRCWVSPLCTEKGILYGISGMIQWEEIDAISYLPPLKSLKQDHAYSSKGLHIPEKNCLMWNCRRHNCCSQDN